MSMIDKYISQDDLNYLNNLEKIKYINEKFVLVDLQKQLNDKLLHIGEMKLGELGKFIIAYGNNKKERLRDMAEIQAKIFELNELLDQLKSLQEKEQETDRIFEKAIEQRMLEL